MGEDLWNEEGREKQNASDQVGIIGSCEKKKKTRIKVSL